LFLYEVYNWKTITL